jgi:hypothetical protein
LATPFLHGFRGNETPQMMNTSASVKAIAPDGRGGLWLAAKQFIALPQYGDNGYPPHDATLFYDLTERVHRSVFHDVANPVREQITSLAAGADGTVLVGTTAGTVYRYDRMTGWEQVPLARSGWMQGGGLATSAEPVTAVAVGPDGTGLAVGPQGRIADLLGVKALLDQATGAKLCDASSPVTPCGTNRNLRAAAIAPNGSAMVVGDDRALLWRPANGQFVPIDPPPAAINVNLTSVSLPSPGHAWISTDQGQVFAGRLAGSTWIWTLENVDASGRSLSLGADGNPLALHGIAVDASGHGFAVGGEGLILERTGEEPLPWARLNTGFTDNFYSVALPAGGQDGGALIGGALGLVLTRVGGRFEVARPSDFYDPLVVAGGSAQAGHIVGLGLLPGYRPGQVEAWAALQTLPEASGRDPVPGSLLHYTNAPDEPLLDAGVGRAHPVPDAPSAQPGEISFAAFGRSECHQTDTCPDPNGSNLFNEVISRRIVQAISRPGRPAFALFTGDVDHAAGRDTAESGVGSQVTNPDSPLETDAMHDRWAELIADPLASAGVPLFAAIGGQDLSQVQSCGISSCTGTRQLAGGDGTSSGWRQAMAQLTPGWGTATTPARSGSLAFRPVTDNAQAAPGEGAKTHYAIDIYDTTVGRTLARLVVLDTALKSVTATVPDENPVESQLKWLSEVLSSRPSSARAIVVSNTPSYTYGPGESTDTLIDSSAFETLMAQNHVTAVISGRVGWNGLYYTSTLVPDTHCPLAGGSYPDPSTGCSPTAPGGSGSDPREATQAAGQGLGTLAGALGGLGAPTPPPTNAALSAYPTVIAASAGGNFGPTESSASGSADQGYWHGYTLVRIEPDGSVVVEQRPILDWIGIDAISHDLRPGQHLQLHGYGREPVGSDVPIQYDDIDSPAITHRYDLVEAEPTKPWLPATNSSGEYVPLDPSVATINRETGFVQTGSGSHPRVYAIAILSVGDKAATSPIVFEPRRDYMQRPPVLPLLPVVIPPAPVGSGHVAVSLSTVPSPPTSPPPAPPEVGSPALPQLPGLVAPPPVSAVSPPGPPPPPAPPQPAAQPQPLPLALQAKLSPIGINATVVPPSPPPVNPAPPSGSAARKEAKQRQAATAESEQGSQETDAGAGEARVSVDAADGKNHPATSLVITRQVPRNGPLAFAALERGGQAYAWIRSVILSAGLILMALLMTFIWITARPTPRRRSPELPAPAWSRWRV